MNKIFYLFKRISSMHYSKMISCAKRVALKNNKSFISVFADMVYCGFKYLAGYVDYEVFGFVNLNKKQRETVITRGVNNKYVTLLNDKTCTKYLDDKLLFNEKFNEYIKRDWLNLKTCSYLDFENFLLKHKILIAKPVNLACGRGIIKIEYSKNLNLHELYNSLMDNKQLLLEEYVTQHPAMSNLYPLSVNTLRIVTVTKNNNTHIMFKGIRMGNSGNIVDNFNHEGLFTIVNDEGILKSPAIDKAGNTYLFHPYTNTQITNFKIPYFEEVIKLVKDLAIKIPEVGYVGWDIAITQNGPLIIEANPFPGHDIYQSKINLTENGTGMKKYFDSIIYNNQ